MIDRDQRHSAKPLAACLGLVALLWTACGPGDRAAERGSAGLLSRPPETRTLPAGTRVVVRFAQDLSSYQSQPGELFRARVERGVVAGGALVVPAGSMVVGSVVEARAGRRPGEEARLGLDFHLLELPSGESVPLAAAISGLPPIDSSAEPATLGGEARTIRIPADAVVTLELAEPATVTLSNSRVAGRAARGQR